MRGMIQRVSVIGLGKLGACMAACFAQKGFPTIGVDTNPEYVAAINAGKTPVQETQLTERIQQAKEKLKATHSYRGAVLESDATFVIVPTPSEPDGSFSLRFAKEAFQAIGKVLQEKSDYHLVVLTSTVLPGGTEQVLLPVLEEASGKKCRRDFGLCYSPEFIALGSVIRDFLNPDFVLIGQSDEKAGQQLGDFYKKVCENNPPIAQMNIVNAELTKVAVNSFMTMKISFANMLAALCEQLPGGNVEEVTRALALFGGVGGKSLRGGLGYGGPCLPRDNVALAALAKKLGQTLPLPEAVDHFNRKQVDRLLKIILRYARPKNRIAILGLAYKPATWVVEESQGLNLASELADRGFAVTGYDPLALTAAEKILGDKINYAPTLEEAIDQADLIVLTTPDPAFKKLASLQENFMPDLVLIDSWRLLFEEMNNHPKVRYVPLGIGAS